MLFWAKLEAKGSWGRRAGTRCPSHSCQVTSQPLERRAAGPGPGRHGRPRARTRPQTPRTRPSMPGVTMPPALGMGTPPGHPRGPCFGTEEQPRGSSPNLGMCQPRHGHGDAVGFSPSGPQGTPPSSPARWPPRCCQHRRRPLRPAGTPAPLPSQPLQEPGAPISVSPCQKGCPAMASCPAPHRGELAGRCWAGSGSSHFLALVGRGGGHDTALQLGKECEQPLQILGCWPCYIRGFSRVTSAPQLASDLVSVATLSRPEGYHSRKTEGPVPEVTPCTTPWVLLPVGRKRQKRQIRLEGLTPGLQHVPCPGPWQGSEPGWHPVHTPCQGTWGAEHLPGPPQGSCCPCWSQNWGSTGPPSCARQGRDPRAQHHIRAQPGRVNASHAAEKNLENPNLELVPIEHGKPHSWSAQSWVLLLADPARLPQAEQHHPGYPTEWEGVVQDGRKGRGWAAPVGWCLRVFLELLDPSPAHTP